MIDHRELMRLHIESLFTHDAKGQMVRVNEPDGAVAPRFFLGRMSDGAQWRFRHDVASDARRELEAAVRDQLCADDRSNAPIDAVRYQGILTRAATVLNTSTGPAFSFPDELSATTDTIVVTEETEHLLHAHLRPWVPDVQSSQPLVALVVDGQAVAVCGSVRRTDTAHEAGVETAPPHRRRGYAVRVVTAWARAVRDMDRTPLYSTSWTNDASRSVARALGLIQFGSDLHIT